MSGELHTPATLPVGKNPGAHWTEGQVDPKVGLKVLQEHNISFHCQESNRDHPAQNLLLYDYTILDPIDELLAQE